MSITPLDEERDAPVNLSELRDLVEANGAPFIKLTFHPGDSEETPISLQLTTAGFDRDEVVAVLREIIPFLEGQE